MMWKNLMSSISLICFTFPIIFFEGKTCKYILRGIDFVSRYKVARPLRTKKLSEVAFVLETIYKKGGVFKYSRVFQCDNGPEFKNEVTKPLEKHNADFEQHQRNRSIPIQPFWKPLTKSWQSCWMSKSFKTLTNYRQFGLKI